MPENHSSRLIKHCNVSTSILLSGLHSSAVVGSRNGFHKTKLTEQKLEDEYPLWLASKNYLAPKPLDVGSNDGFQIRTHNGFSLRARMLMAAAEHANNDGLTLAS